MDRLHRPLAAAALAVLACAAPLHAQDALAGVDREARVELQRLIDEARAAGLPTQQLHSKVREGVARGVPDGRIVAVVRAGVQALTDARVVLGAKSSAEELEAGAAALRAGVPRDALARVREHRAAGTATTSIAVWTDLVARGVPVPVIDGAMTRVLPLGVDDGTLLAMREAVASGARPLDPDAAKRALSRFVDRLPSAPPAPSAGAGPASRRVP